jgi:hypothetical protein
MDMYARKVTHKQKPTVAQKSDLKKIKIVLKAFVGVPLLLSAFSSILRFELRNCFCNKVESLERKLPSPQKRF